MCYWTYKLVARHKIALWRSVASQASAKYISPHSSANCSQNTFGGVCSNIFAVQIVFAVCRSWQ